MPIFPLFVGAGVLFGGDFSLRVSLKFFKVPLKFLIQVNAAYHSKMQKLFLTLFRMGLFGAALGRGKEAATRD